MSVSSVAVPDDTEVIPPKSTEANAAALPDDTEVVSQEHRSECRSVTGRHGGRLPRAQKRMPQRCRTTRRSSLPRAQKRMPQRYRTTRRSSLPKARREYRSGPGRHGGRPSQEHRSECRSGTGRHGGHPSQKPQSLKPSPKKLCASAPLREITVPAELPPTQDCPESSTAHTVASGLIPRFVALSPGVKPVATNLYPQRTIF